MKDFEDIPFGGQDVFSDGKLDAIRNPDGVWINTNVFREEAFHFQKYKYYCPDPVGSPGFYEYWDEQEKRCKEGYSSGGVKITGDHYAYLNFYPILRLDTKDLSLSNGNTATKNEGPPDFWDGDYNFFWARDIAFHGILGLDLPDYKDVANLLRTRDKKELSLEMLDSLGLEVRIEYDFLSGGQHLIIGKSRRKGYSYKNAAILVNSYLMYRNSLNMVGAFLKDYLYPKGTMAMVNAYIANIDEHTAWRKTRDYVDKIDHKRASYKEDDIEKGFKSEIKALTFKDNADAARGKDARVMLFEEAGKFPNLKAAYMATKPALEAGAFTTGQMIIFGTGGDMDGGTRDFADMFYNPTSYKLLPFVNIWDKDSTNSNCGFFHPIYWNMEGFYDSNGNSDKQAAVDFELKKRDMIVKNSNDSNTINENNQEFPLCPEEAFLMVSSNDFPITELNNQLNKVKKEQLHIKKGTPVTLIREDGKIIAVPDLKSEYVPLWDYKPKTTNLKGCPIIFEGPIANPPKGLYKIGYDPYRQDNGTSLGSVYVYKGNHKFSYSRDTIVACYTGRTKTSDDYNRVVAMLAEFYNAEIMHENEVTSVKSYFQNHKLLHLLAFQPDAVISSNVKDSKVARVYGIHMVEKLKDAGEKYIKRWLLTERDIDENGNKILNLNTIYDIGLLEELIAYNRNGNFDRCLKEGSLIQTDKGWEKVESLKEGDVVLTAQGDYKKITKFTSSNFQGTMVDLSTVGNYEVSKVTHNHPILVASTKVKKHSSRIKALDNIEYVEASKLDNKYQFSYQPKRKNLPSINYSEDLLYLIGWCLADGYVNVKTNNISICLQLNQESIADRLMKIIDDFTQDEIGKEYRNRIYKVAPCQKRITRTNKEGYINVVKTSKLLTELLIQSGCEPNNKIITQELYNSNNLLPLVIGYLEGDGHQKNKANYDGNKREVIECSTIYQTLIKQVRQILIDNGIWSSIRFVSNRKGNKDQYSISISGNYINKLLQSYTSLKFQFVNARDFKDIQYEVEDGFWIPIKKKSEYQYEGTVYNFEVEDNHTYISDGITAHNCMAFMMVMFQIEDEDLNKEYGETKSQNIKDLEEWSKKLFVKNR